jgi:hypothetical protein
MVALLSLHLALFKGGDIYEAHDLQQFDVTLHFVTY